METKEIRYKSGPKILTCHNMIELETAENDGVKHTWSGFVDTSNRVHFIWNIDWQVLKSEGAYRLVGHLIVNSAHGFWKPHRVDIDWTDTNHSVLATTMGIASSSYAVTFEYNLTAYYVESSPPEKNSYDEMFVATDKTDVVLIVEGKKLNVSKAFLSFHSDFFSTLFSSNFKEGQMEEIEIKEVSYEDCGLLCSSFYPNPHFPNDQTVKKLLEMARRFQVLSVIRIVEYHLYNSKIGAEKMLWLADEYVMPMLLEKCIREMNSFEKAKNLKNSLEFEKLSVNTRSLILGRLMEFI
ncbi:hypothetical protein B9Z55_007660 [Caenorhabditis nigoni]|uniref:BTB domain-containing protein n=1 Tax=Caenorhabditis nigoni TaxID=1611254 RepID=A0A2G5VAS5_9PELO|nr:hypothetical protein B9Z55_007660 [Caenorhabditis nigoni]